MKLDDLDGSIWPTLADVKRLARRIYTRRPGSWSGSIPLSEKVRSMSHTFVSRRLLLTATLSMPAIKAGADGQQDAPDGFSERASPC